MVALVFILPGESRATVSATDLRAAAACEWSLLRSFDAVLGRSAALGRTDDLTERTAALGLAHEQRVLRELTRDHPGRVVQIPRPRLTRAALEGAARHTRESLSGEAEVIYQAAFVDERFVGFADFVVRDESGRWQVWDTKLSRHESVASLLQLAAYAEELAESGVPVAPDAMLILGHGERQSYPLAVVGPVQRSRRRRLLELLDAHHDSGEPARWGATGVHACGHCPECVAELQATDDVLLVAGVYPSQRKRLIAAGVETMADLAVRTESVPDLPDTTLAKVVAQARMQRSQAETGRVSAEVIDPLPLETLPPASPGDIFFDFEGDPMWTEPGSHRWGLEYLFGIIEAPVDGAEPVFRAFWAHDRAQERQALADFLAYVEARRATFPDMHIYHYAAYEKTTLLRLAARYGVGEQAVDDLLRAGVLVDLYAVVRAAIRVSQDSYSIKKLEPLYMGDDLRTGSVATGGDSIVAYHEFSQAVIEGRQDEAHARLEAIRAYNEYDCLSTLRLRDWLLSQIGRDPVSAAEAESSRASSLPESAEATPPVRSATWQRAEAVEAELRALLGDIPVQDRDADQQALALMAAAVQYNRREQKPFWWTHFDRLRHPVDEWAGQADVFHIHHATALSDWGKEGKQRTLRRVVEITGRLGRGSRPVRVGSDFTVLYDIPAPAELAPADRGVRAAETGAKVLAVNAGPDGQEVWQVEETLPTRFTPFGDLPLALVPKPPPGTMHLDTALAEVAESVATSWPMLPAGPALDLLARRPPRLASGSTLPPLDGSADQFVHAIGSATLDLDHSYLAVQGPPGTGKTYVAAHVIARLVAEHHWKIGVVAQAHAAVENVLDAVVKAGLDPDRVAKYAPDREGVAWQRLVERDKDTVAFAAEHAESGYVIGGTAYDFTHPRRFQRGQLDLLVIDEAGQYSLANTVAVSVVADRLLLLGDPQQLPEVSQGSHPEPIDTSALGWLIEGRPTLAESRGYFLATTYRMHPALADRVSALSYAGSLAAEPTATTRRSLAGIEAGVHVIPVVHRDNTTESVEEAEAIAARIAGLLGLIWDDPDDAEGPRPLRESDIRVVTPYNAQVHVLRTVLDTAGLTDVPAGTVDKFQGQEGALVFISMAASARTDVSRGMGFLLNRNRLNVALSRGKWAAFVVHSPELTDFTPATPNELMLLGDFLRLTGS